jgi:uncharacterized spore protein YtfJ
MADLVEKLTEASRSIGIGAVYGDPVEIDGATIVPVALAWYGFGGGNGNFAGGKLGAGGDTGPSANTDGADGQGFGAGGAGIPIGAYVTTPFGVKFQPNIIALLTVSVPVLWVGGHALSRVIRAIKK